MAPLRVPLRRAEVEWISAYKLALNPALDFGGPEPPELADVCTSDQAFPRKFLQSLRMNFHNGGSFLRIEKRLWHEGH
jgi:hypothetical protein